LQLPAHGLAIVPDPADRLQQMFRSVERRPGVLRRTGRRTRYHTLQAVTLCEPVGGVVRDEVRARKRRKHRPGVAACRRDEGVAHDPV